MLESAARDEAVRKSVRVCASVELAFRVFTEEIDSWWPHTHHIGSSPMTRAAMECFVGGKVYSEQEDGGTCPWGEVLAWEPPHRFVMAWQVNPSWSFEPDPARCSEVEVTFTAADDGTTLIELEHRHFARHEGDWGRLRTQVSSEGGWRGLLAKYGEATERRARA